MSAAVLEPAGDPVASLATVAWEAHTGLRPYDARRTLIAPGVPLGPLELRGRPFRVAATGTLPGRHGAPDRWYAAVLVDALDGRTVAVSIAGEWCPDRYRRWPVLQVDVL